ncbi:MAG: hypothetical protein K5696_04825 [Lachnospiraceae bacterium]|nr:hypothetical protein [Lachnospiraceae bacterium]
MEERTELLIPLRYLYDALVGIEDISTQKQNLIMESNSCQQQILNEQRRRQTTGNLAGMAKSGASAGKVIGIVVTVIGLYILHAIVLVIASLFGAGKMAGSVIGIIFLMIGAGIIYLIVKGTGALSNYSDRKQNAAINSSQNNIANYEARIRDIQERQLPETDARLIVAYQDAQPLIEEFPPDYCYSDAVGRVIFFLENQRADNIKEALNLYENEVYQNKMLAEQQRQTRAAEISAKANMISAAANIVTAFNTGQIAANTSQMVGSLRNIEGYSAQTAANSAAAARSAATAANNMGRTADSSAQMADYARQIRNSLNGNPSWM